MSTKIRRAGGSTTTAQVRSDRERVTALDARRAKNPDHKLAQRLLRARRELDAAIGLARDAAREIGEIIAENWPGPGAEWKAPVARTRRAR